MLKQSVLAVISSNSCTHHQAEQIKKRVICVQILFEYFRLNTGEPIFKVAQLHLHTCLGHSNVVFILYVLYRSPCILLINAPTELVEH